MSVQIVTNKLLLHCGKHLFPKCFTADLKRNCAPPAVVSVNVILFLCYLQMLSSGGTSKKI